MGGANANSTYFYTYLDAKCVKKRTSWRTLKINKPLGLWSWDPLASSYNYGGQTSYTVPMRHVNSSLGA